MTVKRTTSPMTRNQRRKSSEVPSEVKIRKVVPEVPRDEAERGELLEDLQTMGCSRLLDKPWGFKDDRIVRELLDGVTNEFDNTIRAIPTRWTEECWREVYNFSTGGGGLASRKDEYIKDCFKELLSPKDEYAIEDCTDPRYKRMIAFLVPILYPKKPNRITVTMGNTKDVIKDDLGRKLPPGRPRTSSGRPPASTFTTWMQFYPWTGFYCPPTR
jgi:hypothetical protein